MTVYDIGACPVCQAQKFKTLANAAEIKAEVERLWLFHLKRLQPGAPIYELFDRAIFSQKPPLHLTQCLECSTVMRNPRESAEEVVSTYAGEEPEERAFDSLFDEQRKFYRPRARKLTRLNGGAGHVLEVGSYIGGFLDSARSAGWNVRGVDVNARASAYARRQGFEIAETTLEHTPGDGSYDVVALWNCFDQLPDPRQTLFHAVRLLKQNGLVAIRVPNGACYAALRGKPVWEPLLAHNNLLGFPYRHGFSPKGLSILLNDAGFKIEQMRGDTLVSTAGTWTRRWAHAEERLLKRMMKLMTPLAIAPWIEVYARLPYS